MEFVKLGDICSIKTGKLDANASSINGKYPFFTCSKEPLKIDNYSYDCECVLVAGNGDLNVKYYNGKFDAYQRTYIIEVDDKELYKTEYLYLLIESKLDELRNKSIGGVIKYIKLGDLTNILIPKISSFEQENIIIKISKLKNALSMKKNQILKLDELIKSQFFEMLLNNEYPLKKIKDFSKVISGGTPSRSINEYWENGNINWVKTTELNNDYINCTQEKITNLGLKNSSAKIIPKDSILIAMYGQGKTRGMTGYLNVEASTNQACACIICDESVNKKYIWNYLIMSYDKLRDMAKGGNQPNLNLDMIKNFKVSIPPIELQNIFAKFVEKVNKQKSSLEESLEKLEELQSALMQEYFG